MLLGTLKKYQQQKKPRRDGLTHTHHPSRPFFYFHFLNERFCRIGEPVLQNNPFLLPCRDRIRTPNSDRISALDGVHRSQKKRIRQKGSKTYRQQVLSHSCTVFVIPQKLFRILAQRLATPHLVEHHRIHLPMFRITGSHDNIGNP